MEFSDVVSVVILLTVAALSLGLKKFLENKGLAFWEGLWRFITWPIRRLFGRKAEEPATAAPTELNEKPAAPPVPAQTVKVVVEQQPPSPQRPPTAPLLPNPVADFTGRQDDIDKLVARLRNRETAAITAIDGQGGVGKTELAYYVGREVREHYPGGQILLNLRGLNRNPVTPEDAMAGVILALEPEQKLPDKPEQIAGLYQGLLAGCGVLILADNAKDSDQVRPLIPSPPSALLITSRQTIQLAGIERVDLDELPSEEAHSLLRSILGSKPAADDDVARLARLCGNLPIALRVAGNYLASAPALSVADYLGRLGTKPADMTHGGRKVRAVLADSVKALARENPSLVKKWRSLAVFPAPFDRQAAEAVAEFEGDELDTLVGRSLVVYRADEKRFRLHDLMRELAEQGWDEDEAHQARRLHAAHYLAVEGRALAAYLEGGEGVLEGLRLFDQERVQIEAGQAWAAGHAAADDEAAVLAQDYPLRAASVLDLRQHPRERIRWLEVSANAARKLGNRDQEGMALNNLGLAYADLGEARRSIEYYEQDLAICREAGDRRGEGLTLGNLGDAYADLGETQRAIEYYEQDLAITRETGGRRGEGRALGNLGVAHGQLGEMQRAIECFEQVLAIARETGDRRGEGMTLGNLGNAYYQLGETRRAIEYYEQGLEIAGETGDRRGEGEMLNNLGIAYRRLGETRRAIEYYEQDLVITRETGDRRGEGTALFNRALALDELDRRDEAIADARAALQILEQIEDPNADKVRRKLADWGAPQD